LVDAVLTASRVLVAVAARSLGGIEDDVTLAQYRTLVVLASRGPQNAASLAATLGVTASTATRMCDRLIRKGFIRRRAARQDRREVRLALTDAGRRIVDEVTRARRAELASILVAVPSAERVELIRALGHLNAAAGEVSDHDWAPGWT
jgi:DNA-binding MarR family transcriptional regulator